MDKFISRIVVIIYLTMALVPIGYMPAALADGNGYLALCPSGNAKNLLFSKRSSLYETMANQGAAISHGAAVSHGAAYNHGAAHQGAVFNQGVVFNQVAAHQAATFDVRLDHSSHHSLGQSLGQSLGHSLKDSSHHAEQNSSKLQQHGVHKTHGNAQTDHASVNIHNGHSEDNNKCNYATVSSGQDLLQLPPLIPFKLTNSQFRATTLHALVIIALRLRKQQSRAPPKDIIFS
jgi:hypothetical protein